jgi:hypothetical protein
MTKGKMLEASEIRLMKMMKQLKIIRHYLREYFAINREQNKAPIPAMKKHEPVNKPCISDLGYFSNENIFYM